MDEAYELALAREGDGAAAYSEDQWIAWEEALALAPDLAAKKRLVHGAFGATTPDFHFRAALCTLLEVQELLDAKTSAGDAGADALMQKEKQALLTSERELSGKGFWRKAKRVGHRRALLELEIATRLAKPEATIKQLSRDVAAAMGLTLSDPAPVAVEAEVVPTAPAKTALTDDEISTETKVLKGIQLLQYYTDEYTFKQTARSELQNMQPFARELFFAFVVRDKASWATNPVAAAKRLLGGVLAKMSATQLSAVNLTSTQRWWIFELFLDEFTFECADVEGYLDVIVEDLKRTEGEKKQFGSRQAHSRLSFTQLHMLLDQEPSLFRDDAAFAIRYIYFLDAEYKRDHESDLDLRDQAIRVKKLAALEGYVKALSAFSVGANTIRAWILYEQLRELQYHQSIGELKAKFVSYIALPRFGSEVANAAYIRSVKADELIVFESPAYKYQHADYTQPTTPLRVDQVSSVLGDRQVKAKDDLNLIKSILFILWSSGHITDDDEGSIRKYLSVEFVDAQKAECMVVSGCGDISVWKPKLPRNGDELSEWSSNTEISFCESSPSYFSPEDEMEIFVNVRNVKALTVQVYEVRTVDYYTRMRNEVQGDICLDGLLPNEEQVINLSHLMPWHKARIPVKVSPTATGRRGVFVVELFEKDTSCRAILRKGHLRHVQRVTSRGIEFTVLNEYGNVLHDATLMLMNLKGGSSKAQPPRRFVPADSTGVIVIPFRQAGESTMDKFGIIFQHIDFGYLMRGFDYTDGSFSLEAQMYIDHEQLRPGEDATLFVRPILSVGSAVKHIISAEMLTEIKVTVKFSSVNRDSSAAVGQKKVLEFASIEELMQGYCSFTIPLDAEGASVDILAKVRTASASKTEDVRSLPSVTASKHFAVQRVAQFEDTFSPHFFRRVNQTSPAGPAPQYEYFIAVLGHNGERISGKGMTITVHHSHIKTLSFSLESDEHGEIKLGRLEFVEEIRASFSGSYRGDNSWKWELPNLRTYAPQMVNCCTNENIRIALPLAFSRFIEEWIEAQLISLYRVAELAANDESPVLEQVDREVTLSCIKNFDGRAVGVSFQLNRAGDYILLVRPLDVRYPVTVCKLKMVQPSIGSSGLLIQQKKILLATPTRPLMILGYRLEQSLDAKTSLLIQLDEAKSASTQVWVVLKHSLDRPDAKLSSVVQAKGLNNGGGNHFLKDLAFESSVFENEYLKKRKISDEYTYILQRRAFVNANPSSIMLLGSSSLPRPTFIQSPHVLDESDMEALVMRAGEKVSGFKTAEDRASRSVRASMVGRQQFYGAGASHAASGSSISFLAKSSVMMACSAVDDNGVARVCLSDVSVYADAEQRNLELVILAFDANDGQVTSFESQINATATEDFLSKRDVRLATEEALKSEEPSMQLQRHEVLSAGQSRTLPRTFSSKYALYENLQSAMDLWSTLCTDEHIPGLVEQLKNWSVMKEKAKIAFYLKNACDDLNFFVYRKDRQFFDNHVKAYVGAKLSPSMIDLYVLEDTATITQRYGHPAAFQKLSVIEKLIVAERADSVATKQAMCQHVVDVIEGACAADSAVAHQLSRMFDTILSQGAVKPDPVIEVNELFGGYAGSPPDVSASYGAPPPQGGGGVGFSFGSAEGASMQQRSAGGFGASNELRRRAAPRMAMMACSPSSPAYSPTSPAYSQAAAMPAGAPMAFMKKEKMSIRKAAESGDPSDSSDDESDDDDDSDFGVQSLNSDDEAVDDEQEDKDEDDEEKLARKTETAKRRAKPYVLAGKVRRLQEKRYFTSQKPHLDGRNLFWRDYAKHVMQQASGDTNAQPHFLSSHFPEALRSFTEGILALSLLDLAIGESRPTSIRLLAGGHRVQLDAASGVVLYHQGIGSGSVSKEPNSVLVLKQRLVSHSDLSHSSSSDFVDIRPAHEFLVNRIYSCVVSVSNIGSTRLKNLNLLRQIPRGAIPVTSESFYTKNEMIEVAPHDTQMYTCNFYFPEVGQFTQYPAHAALDGEIIAWASTDEHFTSPIVVVPKATAVDLTSWSDVAARGTLQDVITFMNGKPSLASLDLSAVAWRSQEKAFYGGLIHYLRTRWVFNDSIWKYAFLHNDTAGIQEVISSKVDFVRSLGAGIHTSVIRLDEIYYQERFDSGFSFDHTEFGPLLSRRAHRVSGKVVSSPVSYFGSSNVIAAGSDEPARVLHKKAREYYRTLCHVLSLQPTLSANHLLVVTYFLIVFQRIADALKLFERVKALKSSEMRDTTEFSIVADYIDAYLDFFRPAASEEGATRFPVARRNVAKYVKLTNERWRLRFARLQELLDEYDELQAAVKKHSRATSSVEATDSTRKQAFQRVPDDQEVRLQAVVKGDEIHLTSQHLGACEISFYRIDVELMFSTEPFDSFSGSASSKSSLLLIQPWRQMRVQLADKTTTTSASPLATTNVRLPPDLAASPMLLRIREIESTRTVSTVAAPIDLTRSYFNSQLQVVVTKQAGLVQVLHNGLPVSSCYVKVYVKTSGSGNQTRGSKAQFYKDGYTDVIGRFDYANINGDLLTRVEKFSLLVSHPTLGTTVEQVAPPVLAVTSSEFKDREAQEALLY